MTSQIVLRDVSDADLPIFFEHQRDAEANQMAAFAARDYEAFMAHWAKIRREPTGILQTILCDGCESGNVLSFEQEGQTEVGYWIGREFWGQGVATRALAQFLKQVLVRPLFAYVAKHNTGSLRVLEKCGFQRYGEERSYSDTLGQDVEYIVLKID